MNCLKSPISRIGGKFFLASYLVSKLPGHVLYCEPFCGAGHLLFAKEPSQVEILNDIDGYLTGFFKLLKDDTKRSKLIQTLDDMLYSRRLWQDIRSGWKQGNLPQDEIERASQWFYLNRTCFSGDQRRGGFAMPSVTGRNPVQSFRNAIKDLAIVGGRLRSVTIECLDYADCIMRYDGTESLFYIDCPYYGHEHYYGDSFSYEDHRRLAELLCGIKGQVMVSHYDNELYSTLYKGWNKYTYRSFKGSHKAATGTEKPVTVECLFTNFEPVKTRGLFDAMG